MEAIMDKNLIIATAVTKREEWLLFYGGEEWPTLDYWGGAWNSKVEIEEDTVLRDIAFMDIVIDTLKEKVGYIAVYFFLTEIFVPGDYGGFKNIHVGLMLLYCLVSGIQGTSFVENGGERRHLHSAVLKAFSKKFYDLFTGDVKKHYLKLERNLETLCGDYKTRIFSSGSKGDKRFEGFSLIVYLHDSRYSYEVGFKLGDEGNNGRLVKVTSGTSAKKGHRTLVCKDVESNIVFTHTDEMRTNMKDDDEKDETFISNSKIYECIKNGDKVMIDARLRKGVDKNIGLSNKMVEYYDVNTASREFKNIYNSGARYMADLTSGFRVFRDDKTKYIQRNDVYDVKFKIACLLTNIRNFCLKHGIEPKPHQKLWEGDFGYSSKVRGVEDRVGVKVDEKIMERERKVCMMELSSEVGGIKGVEIEVEGVKGNEVDD
jgi:hypothetical protein